MHLDGFHVRSPSIYRMAILAVATELTAMNISVAISALFTNVSEDFFHMAGITRNMFMHTPQWVLGLDVVIELRSLSNGRPTRGGVAILASDCQRAMRASYAAWLSGLCSSDSRKNQENTGKQHPVAPHHIGVLVSPRLTAFEI